MDFHKMNSAALFKAMSDPNNWIRRQAALIFSMLGDAAGAARLADVPSHFPEGLPYADCFFFNGFQHLPKLHSSIPAFVSQALEARALGYQQLVNPRLLELAASPHDPVRCEVAQTVRRWSAGTLTTHRNDDKLREEVEPAQVAPILQALISGSTPRSG